MNTLIPKVAYLKNKNAKLLKRILNFLKPIELNLPTITPNNEEKKNCLVNRS